MQPLHHADGGVPVVEHLRAVAQRPVAALDRHARFGLSNFPSLPEPVRAV